MYKMYTDICVKVLQRCLFILPSIYHHTSPVES